MIVDWKRSGIRYQKPCGAKLLRKRRRSCAGYLILPFLFFIVDCVVVNADPQPSEGPEFELSYSVFSPGTFSAESRTKFYQENSTFRMGNTWHLSNPGGLISYHFSYQSRRFYSKGRYSRDTILYSLDYQLAWATYFSDKFSGLVFFNPVWENALGIPSNKSEDFKFSSGALFRLDIPQISLGLGAMWSRDFGQGLLLPLLYIGWQFKSQPITLRATLPLHAEIWYVPQESWELGVVAHIEGSEYRDHDNRVIFFSTSATRTVSGGDEYLRQSQITFGPEFRAWLTKVFSLSIQGGYTVERRFDLIDFLGKPHDRDLGNSGFVHVKFMLGPKTQQARYFATEQVITHLR